MSTGPGNDILDSTATEASSLFGHLSPGKEGKDHSTTNTLLKSTGLEVVHITVGLILLMRTRHKATFKCLGNWNIQSS